MTAVCGSCGTPIDEADLAATQPGYPDGSWCVPGECRHCNELRRLSRDRRPRRWWRRR